MAYLDFFALPLKKGKEQEYKKMTEKFAAAMKPLGLVRYCEAIADDVPHGKVTDYYRAVQATDGDTVVAAYCEWPDKSTRDKAWEAFMADPKNHENHPKDLFDGKKMFWGGFKPIYEFKK